MNAPRVVIVHYHVRRGGVTHVIQNAVAALAAQGIPVLICSGSPVPPGLSFACPVHVMPELDYAETPPTKTASQWVDDICAVSRSTLGGAPDVWHIHNHALGKNAILPLLVDTLARQARAMLLQTHDFAVDGRPQNYRLIREQVLSAPGAPALYPDAANIHYAALNHRDMARLRAAGLSQVSVLHNPAVAQSLENEAEPSAPLVLYPTRAIRRKNLGEFLLWSALRPDDGPYGVTLAPESPAERRFYENWVSLAEQLALPVTFEMGTQEPFHALLSRATTLMTTSVAEGFGLAFVEPWLNGKPLAGRNLPDITKDFADQGIQFDTLYDELTVPAEWIDVNALKDCIAQELTQAFSAYNREATPADLSDAINAALEGNRLRFGHMNESFQAQIIRSCAASPTALGDVCPNALAPASAELIQSNAKQVRRAFSLPAYGAQLNTLYTTLANASLESRDPVAPDAVLAQFLSPERFMLLRT